MKITRKRLKKKPATIVSPQLIEVRKNYARTVRGIPGHYLLFLYETGFNLHTTNNYGYSPVNIDAYRLFPANRQRNVSLMAIISTNGVLHHKCLVGSYNAESFVEFLDEFFTKFNNGEYNNHTIIMDNVKFHHSQITKNYLNQKNSRYQFLPAYSPALNPIEEVFSTLKARYCSVPGRVTNQNQIISRVDQVIEKMNEELQFSNYYQHMRVFSDQAFSGIAFI
uniref:DDE_3 domain-containing protein n=1 Tax=Strongyloides papillosus TaxID=174720 RepID=A0A0N5B458_STREA